jgi:isoquinoline 1-oxidoreductase subunit beta
VAIDRRRLLIGAAAGGGLLVTWALLPRRDPLPLSPAAGEYAFGAWLKIASDGIVTVAVPQLEMGQGVTTIIPQVVAAELGADWRRVAVEPAPVSPVYANAALAGKWSELWMPALPGAAADGEGLIARRYAALSGFMATADGTSLAAYEQPARLAAAAAREVLCRASADRWGIDWEDCEASGGEVRHEGKRLGFGELAAEAASYRLGGSPVLRSAVAERPGPADIAPAWPRLDLPAKASGSYTFAGDVRLPGMVHAAIRHAPQGRARLGAFDEREARHIAGFHRLVEGPDWLAATGDTWWAAEQALMAISPLFRVSGAVESDAIESALDQALRRGEAVRLAERGEPDEWLNGKPTLAARYDVAPALHATLETASAAARIRGERLELWMATQVPEGTRRAAAAALGMPVDAVVLYPMPAGGSFDRRLEHDHAVEAALIARAVGRPVQLTWSRWQEHVASRPRTPVAAFLAARTAPSGEPVAWKARLALPAATREFGRRLFDGDTPAEAMAAVAGEGDVLALDGAEPPYAIAHLAVDHVPTRIPLATGRLRGNAHGYTAFFTESFVDELARKAGREPLAFRMAMLGSDSRLGQCLQRVSALGGWNGGAAGSGQGLACHAMGPAENGGRIACVAIARQDPDGVRVDRIAAVADIGRIVNLDIARQQIEGGLIFGLGLAIGASTIYAGGLPQTARLAEMGLPLLADCPEIAVEFIDSQAPAFDPGELGVAAVAPAVANALYSATGVRFRRLPLLAEDV